MNILSDSHAAIYEEPIDERIRKFLKLEKLFLKMNHHKDDDSIFDSYVALRYLVSIYEMISRVEVKSELIREIDFHKSRYAEYVKSEDSDKNLLNSIMEKQTVILNNLHNLDTNYLKYLNNDEFFQFCVKHIDNLSTEIDFWLTRDHAMRLNQMDLWVEVFKPIEHATHFCLDILRKSTETSEVCANNGFHLIKLENEKKIRLLRVTMQSDNYFFPRISLGPQRATILFMMKNEENKLIQVKENINFVLDLCYI